MYSLNLSVPGVVERLVSELHPKLTVFDRIRERPTLVAKRFEPDPDPESRIALDRLRERLRSALAGTPAFEARTDGIDYFADPLRGPGPVVYLTVESPELHRVHGRLVREFGAVDGFEGDDYVPHVTLARGGSVDAAERLSAAEVEPVTWTVSELAIWSGEYKEVVETTPLPA